MFSRLSWEGWTMLSPFNLAKSLMSLWLTVRKCEIWPSTIVTNKIKPVPLTHIFVSLT
jgi:hypothetical protein